MSKSQTTAKAIYCPRRQQHAAVCETPNACAGGADCRLGPDLNAHMNDRPSVFNTTPDYVNTADLVLDYLRREKATTPNVASHFGLTMAQARRGLIEMELSGAIRASGHYWEVVSR